MVQLCKTTGANGANDTKVQLFIGAIIGAQQSHWRQRPSVPKSLAPTDWRSLAPTLAPLALIGANDHHWHQWKVAPPCHRRQWRRQQFYKAVPYHCQSAIARPTARYKCNYWINYKTYKHVHIRHYHCYLTARTWKFTILLLTLVLCCVALLVCCFVLCCFQFLVMLLVNCR